MSIRCSDIGGKHTIEDPDNLAFDDRLGSRVVGSVELDDLASSRLLLETQCASAHTASGRDLATNGR